MEKDISVQVQLQRKTPPTAFAYKTTSEPHAARRKQILSAHPEITSLYGYDSNQAIVCIATIISQFMMASIVRNFSPLYFFLCTYLISGTLNHSLVLALHELSHDMFFESRLPNQIFTILANLPLGFAVGATFKRYHAEHHSAMGVEDVDMDVPTTFEAKFFKNWFGRLCWLLLQPIFYGLRPVLLKPKPVSAFEAICWIVQIFFDFSVVYFFGPKSLLYLVGGSLLGTGIHPLSGHFLEHLEVVPGQETYSYYGPLNLLCYNVGYHNEHHDFPRIPGSKLPELKTIASEFYSDLPHYNSWVKVLYDFIFKGNTNLFCRVKRAK